jgi:transcription initiation factor TFIIIB Brf1 subunit/transcription initiation factor TFIIB
MITNCLTKPKCPRCDKQLFCSDIEEYDYVCVNCDCILLNDFKSNIFEN